MIKMSGLYHTYHPNTENPVTALADINLEIHKGVHVAILGPNGCGKSTLAKHFNGLLLPTQGEVLVEGMDTRNADLLLDIRQTVGMVFQNPDNQLVATTVLEEVAFGPENLGMPRELILARVTEALEMVRLTDYKDAGPHHLSGGQKQRLAIAGVIAMRPSVIVFDEPTAMLDPRGRQEVMQTLLKLNREEGITVVNITHFMEEAVLADRVVVMGEGKVVLDGPPREIFRHFQTLRDLHLDIPVMTELAARLHTKHPDIPLDILTVEEMVGAICPSC